MRRLREELDACAHAGTRARNLEEVQELTERFAEAGSAVLDYYASLRPAVAPSILSDDKARHYRDLVLEASGECDAKAAEGSDALLDGKQRMVDLFEGMLKSNATPDQLSRVASSLAKHLAPCIEWWGKKMLCKERMRSAWEATANLPSTTPEMRKLEEATLRVQTGWALYTACMCLESRIALAKLRIESKASRFEPAVRDALMDENGQVRLLGTYVDDALPAFFSTYDAVLNKHGEPLDAEHCTVLEGVMERHSEFASGVERIVASLRDAGTDADLPLEQLDQIVEGAWVAANQVTRLLAAQPKSPVLIEPPAQPAISGKTDLAAESHAARRKGKGKRAPAGGERSSTAGLREPQLARPNAASAPTAKVIVLSDLGTKKLASAEEARARASSSATGHLAMWQAPPSMNALTGLLKRLDELLQFDLPAQQSAVSQARQMKPEDADHVVDLVLKRLQTQAAEIKTCVAALEERRRLLTPAQVTEVHEKLVRLKAMLSEVQGQANSLNARKAAITIDCMKTYAFPSQTYLEQLRAAEELASVDPPHALNIEPTTLFEIKLQPKALRSGRMPSPMWVHIHTKLPVRASQLATLGGADFAACHVKSNEQRGYNRQWQSARAATGHKNVVIHRGKLTPAFCKSLLSIAPCYSLPEAEHASMQFARLRM